MKKAICLMVIGEKYAKLYKSLEHQFINYAKVCKADIVIIDKPLDETFHRTILSQKLLIASKTTNYDIVAFLDLDILIQQKAPSIFEYLPDNKHFGAILDPRGTEEFRRTWQHIPRIGNETSKSYFTDRNFEANENLQGSINGGVFIMRPKKVAKLFSDYYFSTHNQGVNNSHEESPMAYLTQTHNIFEALPNKFNTQILYKLKGTEKGKEVLKKQPKISGLINKLLFGIKSYVYPTKTYLSFVENLLEQTYFLHFAGNITIPKKYYKPTKENISITYGITVCNEAKEVNNLLNTIIPLIDKNDEIIVLQDITKKNEKVVDVLNTYKNNITIVEAKLNNDFASFKNNLIQHSSKNYLFQLDADEIPKEHLIKNIKSFLLKNSKTDAFFVPRINIVNGITKEHIQKWDWKINKKGYINFPDNQARILKLNNRVFWKNKVHEKLYGFNKIGKIPQNEDFCLLHIKNIEKQEQQNSFYNTLE